MHDIVKIFLFCLIEIQIFKTLFSSHFLFVFENFFESVVLSQDEPQGRKIPNLCYLYLGTWLRTFQTVAEKWIGFVPVLFFGRGIFQYNYGIVPHRKPITVVVGKPISVEKVENPTQEQIENLHAKYVEELKKLYQEHNFKYGNENVKLVIE